MTAAWLVCQLCGVFAAPLALRFGPAPESAHQDEECVCPGIGPGQACPMHHTREGERECRLRNARGPADAALMALAGGLGLVPTLSPSLVTFESLEPVSAATPSAIARVDRPDAPPPRA